MRTGKSWSSTSRRDDHRSGRESWTRLCQVLTIFRIAVYLSRERNTQSLRDQSLSCFDPVEATTGRDALGLASRKAGNRADSAGAMNGKHERVWNERVKRVNGQASEGHHHRWWIWRSMRGAGAEVGACRGDTDRSAQLSPVSAAVVSSRYRFALARRDSGATAQCLEPSEKHS